MIRVKVRARVESRTVLAVVRTCGMRAFSEAVSEHPDRDGGHSDDDGEEEGAFHGRSIKSRQG